MKLHHVGIVVQSLEGSATQFQRFFGFQPVSGAVTDHAQRVTVQFLASEGGETSIELIEPLSGESPAGGALKRGAGLNHLCFEVGDIVETVRQAESEGAICVCQPVPAEAFRGRRVAFLYYRGFGLIEFVEAAPTSQASQRDS